MPERLPARAPGCVGDFLYAGAPTCWIACLLERLAVFGTFYMLERLPAGAPGCVGDFLYAGAPTSWIAHSPLSNLHSPSRPLQARCRVQFSLAYPLYNLHSPPSTLSPLSTLFKHRSFCSFFSAARMTSLLAIIKLFTFLFCPTSGYQKVLF